MSLFTNITQIKRSALLSPIWNGIDHLKKRAFRRRLLLHADVNVRLRVKVSKNHIQDTLNRFELTTNEYGPI